MDGINEKFEILLLTNRDSDNVGDQIIEACDIALIHAVMGNLNIKRKNYKISSRAASIVSKPYIKTRDPKLLEKAETAVSKADLVIFGGAPVFNYKYQTFYERTAITLELAQKYGKPVIFSAVGVEAYGEKSKKCQRLKKTLNYDCVKQITTRDGFEELKKYKENENMKIGLVSDPAVFSAAVFADYITEKDMNRDDKKKIGIFVLRPNGFVDNGVDFSMQQEALLWLDVIQLLSDRGYDYELLTSGHYGDEVFLDYLIRSHHVPEGKCVFNINYPETLITRMEEYDGVITCRLHPSIISFAMDIPSVSLVWNTKVTGFYKGIGYPQRAIGYPDFNAEYIVNRLEEAMEEGISKDERYLMSVYEFLFRGIQNVICPDETVQPYGYGELQKHIVPYAGTSEKEQMEKLKRKFRRTYAVCNKRLETIQALKEKLEEMSRQEQTEEKGRWEKLKGILSKKN